ncbi:hypothetical protein GCM10009554_16450 [Kribbella koreensis]|uniref:Uncharacterized protein n=1 Tax=Kribbella koreensis TaxID=57909 RepID=A0ABN1PT88_9ACTN
MTDARMALSLGSDLADRLWMAVPEARPLLAGLLAKEVEDAIRYSRELMPPGYAEVADALYLDLLRRSLPGSEGVVRRCLGVLGQLVREADGDWRWETIDRNIVRMLEQDGFGPALAALDPDFMRLVGSTRKRLGQDRSV